MLNHKAYGMKYNQEKAFGNQYTNGWRGIIN